MSTLIAILIKTFLTLLSFTLFAISSGHLAKRVSNHPLARWGAGITAVVLAIATILPLFFPSTSLTKTTNTQEYSFNNSTGTLSDRELTRLLESQECSVSHIVLEAGYSTCGFTLSENGELLMNGRIISSNLSVSFSSNDEVSNAKRALIYPDNFNSRYFIIQACDADLCWSLWKFDKKHWQLTPTYAGKYGPDTWVQWAPDGNVAVMFNRNEGAYWLHSVYFPQAKRDFTSVQLDSLEPNSFRWLGDREFQIRGTVSNRDNTAKLLFFQIEDSSLKLI